MPRAVGKLHGDRPRFADDVQIGGDESVLAEHEAGSQPLLFAVAAGEDDDDDGPARGFGQLFHCLRLICPGFVVRARRGNDD